MPEFATCSLCTVKASTEDLDLHFKKKHDLSQRSDFYYNKTSIQVDNKEFEVLYSEKFKGYRCPVCISGGNKEVITNHFIKFHITTSEERRYEREIEESEKEANTVYCDICWEDFPDGEDSYIYKTHFQSYNHLKLLKYEEGSGCDSCRVVIDLLKDHCTSNRHTQSSFYKKGEGCDTCKIPFKQKRSLEYHLQKQSHQNSLNYVDGTGCDLCKLYYPKHEETKAHKKKLKEMENIYKKYIAPRRKAKSARK